jgi:hypothetical protein
MEVRFNAELIWTGWYLPWVGVMDSVTREGSGRILEGYWMVMLVLWGLISGLDWVSVGRILLLVIILVWVMFFGSTIRHLKILFDCIVMPLWEECGLEEEPVSWSWALYPSEDVKSSSSVVLSIKCLWEWFCGRIFYTIASLQDSVGDIDLRPRLWSVL